MDHGLPNPMSTCYVNAFLQALMATHAFPEACLKANDPFGFMKLVTKDNEELKKHYFHMLKTLQKTLPWMNVFEFNDVHEFAIMCLDYMHEKSRSPPQSNLSVIPPAKTAYMKLKTLCDQELEKNTSAFSHKFYSTMVLQTDCGNCNEINLNIELALTLDISSGLGMESKFEELLAKHFRSMKVPDWKCDKCNETNPDSTRYIYIWKPAEVILVLLKRTRYKNGRARKLTAEVDMPFELNIDKFVLSQEEPRCRYRMTSLCTHLGDLEHGHYTAAVVSESNELKEYDDMTLSDVDRIDKNNVYMIVYEKM